MYERVAETKKRRVDNTDKLSAAGSLLDLSGIGKELKAEADNKLTEQSFKDNDKVKYYAGLSNFATLIVLFNFLGSSVETGKRSMLSLFQQLIVTLMNCMCTN